MSMWKDQSNAKKDAPLPPAPEPLREAPAAAQFTPTVSCRAHKGAAGHAHSAQR